MTKSSKVEATAAPKAKPPNAGKGRVKGVPNKTTGAVKAALLAVYADLQAQQDGGSGDHAHLLAWAKDAPTEFYKLWAKMLPTEVSGPGGGPIEMHELADDLAALPKGKRDAVRAALLAVMGKP